MPPKILITATLRGEVMQQHAAGRMGTVIIGRAPSCDVILENVGVSRVHAEISFKDDKFHFDDLGSSNGSLLNGARVDQADLDDGDVLTISKFELHISIPADDEPPVNDPFLAEQTIQVRPPSPVNRGDE